MERTKSFTIGDRLRRVRELAGMSQNDVSVATGVAVSLISRYERNIINPGWQQIEKILEATGMTPCDLFHDFCSAGAEDEQNTFAVDYHARLSPDGADITPTSVLRFRKQSSLLTVIDVAAVDGRYALVRACSDMMVPDIYPGDLYLVDKECAPGSGKIVVGFAGVLPTIGRMVRHSGQVYIVPSNRRYSTVVFDPDQWDHHGCVIYCLRDLTIRFMAGKRFTDETSDVISIEELTGRGGAES